AVLVKRTMILMKAHCPRCAGERQCDVHGHAEESWETPIVNGNSSYGQLDHRLLRCRGCEQVFYHQSSWSSEDADYAHDPVMVAMAMDLDTVVGEVEEAGHKMAKRLGMMPSATGQYPESVFELAVQRLA